METLDALVLYALLTAAMYYLGARADVTAWLWRRYPKRFGRFMDCPACAGFWYGIAVAVAIPRQIISLPAGAWWTPILVGLCSMVWTPIVAAIMQASFERVGSAVDGDAT